MSSVRISDPTDLFLDVAPVFIGWLLFVCFLGVVVVCLMLGFCFLVFFLGGRGWLGLIQFLLLCVCKNEHLMHALQTYVVVCLHVCRTL